MHQTATERPAITDLNIAYVHCDFGQERTTAAEKIRKLVADSAFESGGIRVSITVSIGVAVCPQDGLVPERVLAAADAALYRAKDAGRNRTSSASRGSSRRRRVR